MNGRTHCNDWDSDKPEWLVDKRTGKTIGRLMPRVRTFGPGIQSWSRPGGELAVQMHDETSVARFADHWERKHRRSYPYARG